MEATCERAVTEARGRNPASGLGVVDQFTIQETLMLPSDVQAWLKAVSRAGLSLFGPSPAGPSWQPTKGLGLAQGNTKPEPASWAGASVLTILDLQ